MAIALTTTETAFEVDHSQDIIALVERSGLIGLNPALEWIEDHLPNPDEGNMTSAWKVALLGQPKNVYRPEHAIATVKKQKRHQGDWEVALVAAPLLPKDQRLVVPSAAYYYRGQKYILVIEPETEEGKREATFFQTSTSLPEIFQIVGFAAV